MEFVYSIFFTRGDLNRDIFIYERRPQICAHAHTHMLHVNVCVFNTTHKHSLCIKSGSIDGSGNSSRNNLSINQVTLFTSPHLQKKATAATTISTQQSIGWLAGLSFGR